MPSSSVEAVIIPACVFDWLRVTANRLGVGLCKVGLAAYQRNSSLAVTSCSSGRFWLPSSVCLDVRKLEHKFLHR